jgi:acetyl esterase/lipase
MPSAATQRTILHALLSLPVPMLRLMAGGGVVYQGGRTLDPRLQYIAAQARGAPPMTSLTPQEARLGSTMSLAVMTGAPEPGVRFESVDIPGPSGTIPARLYRPEAQDSHAPLMIFGHFGGGVIGDL